MASGSQCGVYVDSFRLYGQPFQHLMQKHRYMWCTQLPSSPYYRPACNQPLNPRTLQRFVIGICIWIALQLIQYPRVVHHHQVV